MDTRPRRLAAALLLLGLAVGSTRALAEEGPAKLLEQAKSLRGRRETWAQALTLCGQVAAEPKATRDQKLEAYDLTLDILRDQRKFDAAVKVMDELRAAFPGDQEVDLKAFLAQLQAYWDWNKSTEGLAKARELLAKLPGNKPACAQAQIWLARLLQRAGKRDECYEEAKKAIDLDPGNDKLVAEALWFMADATWAKGDMAKFLEAAGRLIEPKYIAQRGEWERFDHLKRYGEALLRLERFADARAHYLRIEKEDPDPRFRQECCLLAAQTFAREKRFDDAVKAYERVFTGYPDLPNQWRGAQEGIIDALRQAGKLPEAIQAARIDLDSARDRDSVAYDTRIIAELLKEIDANLGRANLMINFQRFGPAGEDGKPGTADDLKSPLDAFAYPSYPDRERAFAEARKRAGDDSQASRFRGLTCLYTGHPREALKHYLDGFSRATGNDLKDAGYDLLVLGVRAARGHGAGLEPFVDFLNYGPAGEDGKPGTADDLQDPFAPLLK